MVVKFFLFSLILTFSTSALAQVKSSIAAIHSELNALGSEQWIDYQPAGLKMVEFDCELFDAQSVISQFAKIQMDCPIWYDTRSLDINIKNSFPKEINDHWGEAVLYAAIAHEWGHHLMNQYSDSNTEVRADCVAGAAIGIIKGDQLTDQEFSRIQKFFLSAESFMHGHGDQRATSFAVGFRSKDLKSCIGL